ncbi:hypothetical protein [Hydrogenophaga sp.]|uniref:hypothetical protein n=1 Tax=Hydrogenophaga sp. TaxID=1904254 RepID=UPI002621F793|nr:hypothetical protein [Hydrogenophaga sp.]MCW5652385.1 hypothetical protein [Hydrogenophaga sp.]
MLPSASVLRRILWPKQASMFVIIGGAAGLIGDMTSFFASFISPPILAVLFLAAALATAWVCFNKAADVDVANASAVESVVECGACDALRFSLFAAVAFGLFMLIGQGQSATETVGEKLGLIQKDVAEISGNVRQLTDMTQSQRIRSNPKTAEDYFANAWIYSNIQRDQSKAHASLVEMYGRFGPRKLDAAELFFSTGRELKGRNELITQMAQIAEQRKDATLLVVAARNAATDEDSARLNTRARELDPDLPFAWWDVQQMGRKTVRATPDPVAQSAMIQRQVDDLKVFLQRMGDQPAGRYFFLPQYQGDHEMLARQTLTNFESTLKTYERILKRQAPAN